MLSKKIKTIVNIDGMSCSHCASKVKTSLESIKSVTNVKVNIDKKEAIIASTNPLDMKEIKNTIEKLGYYVTEKE